MVARHSHEFRANILLSLTDMLYASKKISSARTLASRIEYENSSSERSRHRQNH
mgnify:FL=1